MVAVVGLDRHLYGLRVGRGGIVMLHRLQAVLRVRRSMSTAAGFHEQLIRRNRMRVVLRHRAEVVASQLRIVDDATLIMARGMGALAGIASVGLSQREIFVRRRRCSNIAMMSAGRIASGYVLCMLECRCAAGAGIDVTGVVVIGLRDEVLIGLCGIGHRGIGVSLAQMLAHIVVARSAVIISTMVILADV
jgi:hypothetical protein